MNVVKGLIEGITQDITKYLCEDKDISISDALNILYNSITFEKLNNNNTGLHRESSAYVYELLKDEIIEGKLTQKEI
jgi:hypothetical protein